MSSSSVRNNSRQIQDRAHQSNERQMTIREVQDSVRESRQGFRGTGMYQLSRYYSQEGLLVIGMGGPPTVGK